MVFNGIYDAIKPLVMVGYIKWSQIVGQKNGIDWDGGLVGKHHSINILKGSENTMKIFDHPIHPNKKTILNQHEFIIQ